MCTKYKVYDRLKSAGEATVARLAEINNEYHVTERASEIGVRVVDNLANLDATPIVPARVVHVQRQWNRKKILYFVSLPA